MWLVGGAVRDLLLGRAPVDVDIAVSGDALSVAQALAARSGGRVVEHDRFGTASVVGLAVEVNVAATRRESYSAPGALPDVEPAGLEEDLARRDFTVNAMAMGLVGDDLGVIHDPYGGRADLDARLVRVLHERSFEDDPTRLLRAVRYAARLGGRIEPHTEELARAAIEAGSLGTVSGQRTWDELRDLLTEDPAALELMHELGLDRALHPALRADADRVASARLAAGETGADPVLAALAALAAAGGEPERLGAWLDGLGLRRDERDRVLRAATRGEALAQELRAELTASALHSLLRFEPAEALAVALAFGAPGEPVLRYVGDLRHTRLAITGDDLLEAGVPESPAVGRALEETLRRKLDGQVSGREEELATALELARGGG